MDRNDSARLFEFADLVLAVARELRGLPEVAANPCTPVESVVMRVIDRNPGTSARAVGETAMLPSSNLSRVLRGLETKGLVRREANADDSRAVRLYPTAAAHANLASLRSSWGEALAGIGLDPATLDQVNATLSAVEQALRARRAADATASVGAAGAHPGSELSS